MKFKQLDIFTHIKRQLENMADDDLIGDADDVNMRIAKLHAVLRSLQKIDDDNRLQG